MFRSTSFPFQEFLVPHLHQTSSQTQTLLVFSPATNSWRQGSALLQLYWRVMRPDGGGWGCALSVCFSELSLSSLERVFPSPLETVTAVWNNLPPQDLKRDKTGSICHVTHCRFRDWLQEALHGDKPRIRDTAFYIGEDFLLHHSTVRSKLSTFTEEGLKYIFPEVQRSKDRNILQSKCGLVNSSQPKWG